MNRQEQLVLLLIALVLVGKFGMLGRDMIFARLYGNSGAAVQGYEYWELVSYLLASVVNLGSAIWLLVEAKAADLRAFLWAVFGLVFGLLGVALFYLIQLYGSRERSGIRVRGNET